MTCRPTTAIIRISLLALLLIGTGCTNLRNANPTAHNGVIDLSGLDFASSGPVGLDGWWEFYWHSLLSPDDFHKRLPVHPSYLRLPGSWNGNTAEGLEAESSGYATFRLRILLGDNRRDLALRLGTVESAYRLWANGSLITEGGALGTNDAEEEPTQYVRIPRLPDNAPTIELVMQVSNFHYSQGGVISPLQIGRVELLEAQQFRKWGVAFFCIGAMVIMGTYHLVFFCFRRKNAAPLYFGCYCFLWAGFLMISNVTDWAANLLTGWIPAWALNRLDILCFVVSVPVGYAFFRTLFPDEFSLPLQRAISSLAAMYAVAGVALPTITLTSALPIYYLLSGLLILYCLARLFTAMRRAREGAFFILVGFLFLGSAGLNDMLYDTQVIRSVYLIGPGVFVFVLLQAFALSIHFARAFTAVERLSDELTGKNLSLEREMAERTRLEREIVNVSEEERRYISHELHDGLCQMLTAIRLHFSALRRKMGGTAPAPPEFARLSNLLEAAVDHAYDLSRGLWPVEHSASGNILSLQELLQRLRESSGIAIEFRQKRGCPECSGTAMTQLYRIAQEAVTNAVKHAQASKIVVGLDCADRKTISLTVEDNGVGNNTVSTSKGGLGLKIMAHRARIIGGRLTIADGGDGGTLVSCFVPCEISAEKDPAHD